MHLQIVQCKALDFHRKFMSLMPSIFNIVFAAPAIYARPVLFEKINKKRNQMS